MTILYVRKDGEGRWLNTDFDALDQFFLNRVGHDLQLAKIIFPTLPPEDIDFILEVTNEPKVQEIT